MCCFVLFFSFLPLPPQLSVCVGKKEALKENNKKPQHSTILSVFTECWQTCEATRCHNQRRITDISDEQSLGFLTHCCRPFRTLAHAALTRTRPTVAPLGAAGCLPSRSSDWAVSELSERFLLPSAVCRKEEKNPRNTQTDVISASELPR